MVAPLAQGKIMRDICDVRDKPQDRVAVSALLSGRGAWLIAPRSCERRSVIPWAYKPAAKAEPASWGGGVGLAQSRLGPNNAAAELTESCARTSALPRRARIGELLRRQGL